MIRLKSLEIFNFKRYEHEKLDFPLQGRFLIKGKNEAGKSSIFEAIVFALFGKPVYIRSGKENLINFSQDKARVILNLDLDEKELYIERTLKRNSSQECFLKIYDKKNPEKVPIILRKVNDVDERIEKELGLDYITLLNTCFVEQKNIGRLENSDKATRQKIIISLFNLEFLTDLSKRVKEEKEILEEKLLSGEIIREACKAKKQYPFLSKELSKIKQEKTEIEAVEKAKKIKEEKGNIEKIEKEIEKISKIVEEYKEKIEILKKNLEELNKLEKIFDLNKILLEKIEIKKNIENKINEDSNKIKEIPRLLKEIENLKYHIKIKRRIEKLGKIRDKLEKLEEEIERFSKLSNNISEKEKEIKKIDSLIEELRDIEKALQVKKLEEDKENLRKIIENFEEINRYKKELEKINKTLEQYFIKITICSLSSLIFLISSFLLNILYLPIFFLFLIILIFLVLKRNKAKEQEIKLNIRKEDLEKELKNIKEEDIQKRFEEIKKEISKIVNSHLKAKELNELISLKAKRESELEKLKELEETLIKEKEEFDKNLTSLGFRSIQELIQFKNEKMKKWEEIFNRVSLLDSYTHENLEYLTREESRLEERVEILKSLTFEVEKNKKEVLKIEEEIKRIKEEIKNLSKEVLEEPTKEYKEKIEETIKKFKEEKIEDKFEYYRKILEQKTGERKAKIENLERLIKEFQINYPEKDWESLSQRDVDYNLKENLERREKEINEELAKLKFIMESYEKNTGKKIEELDPDKEEENLNKMEREKVKMSYAQQILEGTTKKILDTVSPRTLAYMQKILPILTMDRYHIVHLDSETFKLKVFDNISNRYYDKDILSGGTQDQFSLALRLAFAIANLPQDRGTNPGFIFLDEPLGSFDDERAHALIELLTHGEIAEHFDQIFVITHVLLKEEYFDYCIHVEEGRIIYKDL
ncbi:MAG: SMC family ATPase [Dictyoglomus sp.]|nr:SMC family ATPase [Dictyoglomus sp.]MDW8187862.1 SMC family ATPase [Dictyoglomus sp.]